MRTSPASKPPDPTFAAVSLEAFPAQVLASQRPDLRGRPFAVVRQSRNGHKTVVFSCSPEAAALGVHPGMPVPVLEKKFPRVPLVLREERLEATAREDLGFVLNQFTPDFIVKDSGAAILDITGTPLLRESHPKEACSRIRSAVLSGLGFRSASLGLAGTALAAQVLARKARPDGIGSCTPGTERSALAALPPTLLPDLSPTARDVLRKYVITSIGQLLALGRETLLQHFGREGERIYALAAGFDLSPVRQQLEQMDAETTLERDINDADLLNRLVRLTADRLVFRLRKEGYVTDRFTLEIRYADNKSGQRTFECLQPTQDFNQLVPMAQETFQTLYTRRVAIKSLRLIARKPRRFSGQLDLFWTPSEERQNALGRAMDRIRSKHSFNAVLSGSNVRIG